jgi:hypothetical protein
VRLEGLGQLKNSMTSSGIVPAIIRLVAQCLNKIRYRVPRKTLPACQKADGNTFLGQKKIADGGIHARRGHNNVISVLRNTKKLRKEIQNNADIRCSAPP